MSEKKAKKPNRTYIGGQAVIEGVMMRGKTSMATSVRDDEGKIRLETERVKPIKERNIVFRIPIIRGAVNFFVSLVSGMKIMMRSAEVYGEEESEPSKFEKWLAKTFKIDVMSVVLFVGVLLGIALALFLFIMCPQWLTSLIGNAASIKQTDVAFNFIEGGLRILLFVVYLLLTSLLKDIKRTYMYHGAEHKTITCYERGLDLTVENVRTCSRVHDRCGTTFMFFVMMVSVFVFSIVNSFIMAEGVFRILIKIAMLPLVAGLSYELLKGLAKTDCWVFYPIKLPGLLLQKITTKEPTDDMIEVAINSFQTVLKMDEDLSIEPVRFVTPLKVDELLKETTDALKKGGVLEESDAEWIVARVSGKKRSELKACNDKVAIKDVLAAREYVSQRLKGLPLCYVFGDADFYGYTIKTDKRALVPRPETEELVFNALKSITENSRVLDLCTGSGAIAISIYLQKKCKVVACDISKAALELAKENAEALGAEISFVESDLLENIDGIFDLIITNPPYIKSGDIKNLDKEVLCEPELALNGGEDGLDFYRRIAVDAPKHLEKGGILICECGFDQAESLQQLFGGFASTEIISDAQGVKRIVKAVL